jgi:hypothetical protein
MPDRFERFTQRSQKALQHAQAEAVRLALLTEL